jgi:phage FluMu gp28-like protein
LRADLHKVRKVVGETGGIRLVADDDSEGHADRFWAGMLAIAASKGPPEEFGYDPVPLQAIDNGRDEPEPAAGGFGPGAW